jgi:2-methylisocitrate lyase-like PEP mutase family enzyme
MLIVPGAYDALSARMVEQSGYEAVLLAGGTYTSFHYGLADRGYIAPVELVEAARRVNAAVDVPLILDFDDAGGTPRLARRNVPLAEQVGVAALLIEDLRSTTKLFTGSQQLEEETEIRDVEEMTAIIRSCVEARTNPDTLIVIRSDAHKNERFEEFADRLKAYVGAGADLLYPCGYPFMDLPRLKDAVPAEYLMYASRNPTLAERSDLERSGVKVLLILHTVNGAVAGFRNALDSLSRGELLPGESDTMPYKPFPPLAQALRPD